MRTGRPTKYLPEYCQQIIDFFDIPPYEEKEIVRVAKTGEKVTTHEDRPNDLRFISAFARSIGVCSDTLREWATKHEDFSASLKKAKELQKEHLITCGLKGLYSTSFACFTAKNITDMKDHSPVPAIVNIDNSIRETYVTVYLPGKADARPRMAALPQAGAIPSE